MEDLVVLETEAVVEVVEVEEVEEVTILIIHTIQDKVLKDLLVIVHHKDPQIIGPSNQIV